MTENPGSTPPTWTPPPMQGPGQPELHPQPYPHGQQPAATQQAHPQAMQHPQAPWQGQSVPGAWGGAPGPPVQARQPNFFSALFDFSFTNYVTVSFAKMIYSIAIGLIVFNWLGLAVIFFAQGEPGYGTLVLLFGSIIGFILIVAIRLGLEYSVASIRTAEHTGELARQQSQRQ